MTRLRLIWMVLRGSVVGNGVVVPHDGITHRSIDGFDEAEGERREAALDLMDDTFNGFVMVAFHHCDEPGVTQEIHTFAVMKDSNWEAVDMALARVKERCQA